MQEYRGLAVGEACFEADDPGEAGGLGDEKRDEECVFHIGVVVGGGRSGRKWDSAAFMLRSVRKAI